MRITIRMDDDLYKEVKASVARSGRAVAAVLEDAVRRGLQPDIAQPARRYAVRPIGRGWLRPDVDLMSNAAVAEAMTEHGSIDALR
ncbi:ribbon-helix-helix protein, CopG family [Mycobacterium sp. M1]|uniref:Ribbon-helix-helix protein, CopG family n=1 Tax=Mycolicibacter acidiphilus TaxID=2835306 RepID=A0ABS5RKK8_9MYCO|nr:ribbon-helix-helix protein, CopG family [Mycolicibacter acidiphilus]MBS9534828.1 ribbon-helix-helix protein, CopG family [Mycolicibacter acidiphilus]